MVGGKRKGGKRKEPEQLPAAGVSALQHEEDLGQPADLEEDLGQPADLEQDLGQLADVSECEAPAVEPPPIAAADEAAAAAAAAAPSAKVAAAQIAPKEQDALALELVEVRDTGSAKGMGLFARQELPDNTWVGDYLGEVLSQEQYLQRYPNEDPDYVLAANTDYNIDAADPARSSFLRYANHSSDFNMIYDVLRVRGRRDKQVKFYTSRRVAPGEELVFDYGEQYWTDRKLTPLP
eukprot:Transcript_6013.p1 GENE.Transcript_6013~~Transcript_6013.p1  ORF type:complete len:236 (-),score=99.50 Transcript_6013:340-1047(-)